jgi:hypothetical protein
MAGMGGLQTVCLGASEASWLPLREKIVLQQSPQ